MVPCTHTSAVLTPVLSVDCVEVVADGPEAPLLLVLELARADAGFRRALPADDCVLSFVEESSRGSS